LVDLSGAKQPIEVLERFLEKFGLDVEIEGERRRLFVSKMIRFDKPRTLIVRVPAAQQEIGVPVRPTPEGNQFAFLLVYSTIRPMWISFSNTR
jgi:hypothetical protein